MLNSHLEEAYGRSEFKPFVGNDGAAITNAPGIVRPAQTEPQPPAFTAGWHREQEEMGSFDLHS